MFVKTAVGLVPEKLNGRHLLPAVCVGHGGELYVRTEHCPEDAGYRVLPGPLLPPPPAVAHWELWSSVSGRLGILFLGELEFLGVGLAISRSEMK